MPLLLTAALLALTRAEIIQRMRAPVVTQADGMVKVYADCGEDVRREFQAPVARFAADTVRTLAAAQPARPVRAARAGIVIHIGDVRTNDTSVIARAVTNDTAVFTRIRLPSPAFADLDRFRLEVVKAFSRCTGGRELSDADARRAWRRANPDMRIADARRAFEDWFCDGKGGDEEGFRLMRTVIKPGFASRRDVLVFASRLFLYPPYDDQRFSDGRNVLSFRAAISARRDPLVRLVAAARADGLPVFGGGRGPELSAAAEAYRRFLVELARGDKDADALAGLLEEADILLNVAYEKAETGY